MKISALSALVAVGMLAGGCASNSSLSSVGNDIGAVVSGISLVTKSVANPVTPVDLYEVESSVSIGFTALQTYRKACLAGAADKNCRANVEAIQVYTRQIPPYLAQLRSFVKNNDQVDAAVVYNQIMTLYSHAKAAAANAGVRIGT